MGQQLHCLSSLKGTQLPGTEMVLHDQSQASLGTSVLQDGYCWRLPGLKSRN